MLGHYFYLKVEMYTKQDICGPRPGKLRTFAKKMQRWVRAIIGHSKALAVDAPNDAVVKHAETNKPHPSAEHIIEFNRQRQRAKEVEMHGIGDIAA